MDHTDRQDRSPAIAELLDDAYVPSVDVETASRHLWMIHKEADRLRAQAVAEGPGQPSEVVPDTIESLALRRSIPRAAVPLLVAVMMMSSSGMALAASQSSLPGDILYPVKRGTESAQLVFARDPDTRAQLQLAFARTRLDEIRQIGSSRPQHVAELVSDISVSLAEVEQSAPEAAPASQRIRQETTEQIASLSLPGTVTQAVDQAMTAPAPTATTTTTATATAADDRTVTPPAQPSASTTTTASAAASATPTPTTSESVVPGTASADADPTVTATDPAPSGSATTGTGSPSASEGSGSPSPSPSSSEQPATPVVTPRPHPSGEGDGGTSRTEDEPPTAPAEDEVQDDPSAQPTSDPTLMPFTRPQD